MLLSTKQNSRVIFVQGVMVRSIRQVADHVTETLQGPFLHPFAERNFPLVVLFGQSLTRHPQDIEKHPKMNTFGWQANGASIGLFDGYPELEQTNLYHVILLGDPSQIHLIDRDHRSKAVGPVD